ncbi:MAG TPA: hypothetical protein VLM39_11935 [Ignavibacteriaceae bacterium]|nr:hypothetical protein [Ignavibacteriaceae bacterium]
MKKKILLPALLLAAVLYLSSCKFGVEEEAPASSNITITGQIAESITGNPIFNASIRITDGNVEVNTTTDSEGKFTAEFTLAEDKELVIFAFKEGYSTDTLKFFAAGGKSITLPLIQIKQIRGTGGTSSGSAASIYIFSQSVQSIGVKESGSNETAQIIFQVLDSTGVPINSDNSVSLTFSFGTSPAGGEFLYPASVLTNALGRANVTLNTGTKAGVAQIMAEMTVNDVTIRSKPVLISIHGGFPDENHFAVASEKLNYPVWGIVGYEIPFTAFVGDKYTNPVRPQTSVYFSTTSGIIEGSNLTDELGRSTVTLLTQPYPNHPIYGAGFFAVTASTINENNENIQTETVRLLSGLPIISEDPTIFNIPNGGSQLFNYTVSDANANPLAEGTTISVKVAKGDLKVTGDVDIKMLDTQDKIFTRFSFTASDTTIAANFKEAIISIETSGPNGEKKISIYGTAE